MRIAGTVLILALACAPASAAGWVAQMEEDEGGPVLAASVSGPPTETPPPALRITCGSEVGLRYDPASVMQAEPGDTAAFAFSAGADPVTREFAYEDMDGMFAAYMPDTDPLMSLLMAGAEVTISDPEGRFPARTFTLSGSRVAIGAVLASCTR